MSAPSAAASAAAAPPASAAASEVEHVIASTQIWRSHGSKQKAPFVPPTLPSDSGDAAAAAAASSSGPPRVVPPVEIDTARFDERITIVALRVPAKKCGVFLQQLRSHLYDRPRIPSVIDGASKDEKYILLSFTSLSDLQSLPAESRALLESEGAKAVLYSFDLSYDYFPQEHVLKTLLPAGLQIPAGFESVGHIAHLNLTDEQRPYGKIVARVILDKNPHLHTVVNKVGAIASEFRVFPMELLAGVDCTVASLREHGCDFVFDFARVYWNSKLSTEHTRLVSLFRPKQLIADLTCGIGPFVIPTAKKLGAQKDFLPSGAPAIWANDLNPDSARWLGINLSRNKVSHCVSAHNLDARRFLWDVLRKEQITPGGKLYAQPIAHALMNLPALALDFLDAFVGLYADDEPIDAQGESKADPALLQRLRDNPPLVHAYCFSRAVDDPLSDIVPRITAAFGGRAPHPAVVVREEAEQQEQRKKQDKVAKKKGKKEEEKAASGDAAANASAAASSSSASSSSSSLASLPPPGVTHVRFVRNVAPNKDMFCVSLYIPAEVLAATPTWRATNEATSTSAASSSSSSESASADEPSAGAKRKAEAADTEQAAKKSK